MVQTARLQQAKLVIKIPSNTITKKQNETLNVRVNCTYQGPAQRVLFYAVVTQQFISEFDEIGSTKKNIYMDFPETPASTSYYFTISGLPLSGVEPKTSAYGVKVKAQGTFGTVEAGNKACLYVQSAAGISFQVGIWGIPPDFGSYQKWWAYYWDPGISNFVSCGKWYSSSEKITFSNVQPGGYLAVFLMKDSTVSSQYTSPTFQAVNGGIYQYDVQLGRVTKIG